MTTKEKEQVLYDLLQECLSSANQDGSIEEFDYAEKEGKCYVTLSVVEVPEDDYIGFQGY